MSLPLLEGEVLDSNSRIPELEMEIARLRGENQRLRAELLSTQTQASSLASGVRELRSLLSPLHRSLRMVFGEIEGAVGSETDQSRPATAASGVWQSWISKLPGKQADVIRVLLEHGPMTAAQLRIAVHCATDTVYQTVSKLGRLGLLTRKDNKYCLKDLQ